MSLYRRKGSSKWYIKLTILGETIYESTGTSDKIQAQELHDKLQASFWEQKRLGIKPRKLWKEAVIRWVSETSDKATHAEDISKLVWLNRFLREKKLDEINLDVIQEIRTAKLNENVSKITVNRYLALIRSILIRARDEWEWIDKAPKIRLYKEDNERERALSKLEAKALLQELPEHQRVTVLFALATGLRQKNILDLKWSQIDFENRHLSVSKKDSKNRKGFGIPLNDLALKVLKSQFGRHSTRVFTFKGQPIAAANTAAWKKALKRAGVEDFRWHDLRHTWATWQRKAGTPTHELQRLGGWKTAAMVERYAHIAPEGLEYAASRLNTFFESYDLVTA